MDMQISKTILFRTSLQIRNAMDSDSNLEADMHTSIFAKWTFQLATARCRCPTATLFRFAGPERFVADTSRTPPTPGIGPETAKYGGRLAINM
jgi:hypothetical protein